MIPEAQLSNSRLNWLRAAVLGANDGIVSTAAIILGVAGATDERAAIITAGMAGLIAGALSMGLGEYVSVSSQRDSELAFIEKEKQELAADPEGELQELADIYQAKGLTSKTARKVAEELTAHDVIKAHLEAELKIDEEDLSSPTHAALASALSFTAGALIPLGAVLVATTDMRFVVTFGAVLIALIMTGYLSATVGGASRRTAMVRLVVGGALAMVITYGVGHLFGAVV